MRKISDKKKKRLKENGTEGDLFRQRFIDLEAKGLNYCMVTGKYLSATMISPASFPHILSKKMYPILRYSPNNIGLVYGIKEHAIFDKAVNLFKKRYGEKILEVLIATGEEIDLKECIAEVLQNNDF